MNHDIVLISWDSLIVLLSHILLSALAFVVIL